ncbi:MAG: hypothetical protein Q8P90_06035 [bacterium]|nr:hypothetical protein [bacterium]
MRVIITGLEGKELGKIIRNKFSNIKIVKSNPDFILCYGGDGTLLYAEREYPGVPKVMIRHSRVCHNCARVTRETILSLLSRGKYYLREHPLLEAASKGSILYGLNDIIVGHATINTSLRYSVSLNGEPYGGEYLGDGLIVATPLGSTGYYQSVTQSTFQEGLGVAFNNTVNIIGHLVIASDTEVKVKVNRGPGLVVADNAKKFLRIDKGESVVIKQSHRSTHIVYFKGKKYRQYNIGLGENRVPLGFCQICSKQFY